MKTGVECPSCKRTIAFPVLYGHVRLKLICGSCGARYIYEGAAMLNLCRLLSLATLVAIILSFCTYYLDGSERLTTLLGVTLTIITGSFLNLYFYNYAAMNKVLKKY